MSESASRAPLAAFLLGSLFVAGPVLAWATSLSSGFVAVVLFGIAFVVALVRAFRMELDGSKIAMPIPLLTGMVLMVPTVPWTDRERQP